MWTVTLIETPFNAISIFLQWLESGALRTASFSSKLLFICPVWMWKRWMNTVASNASDETGLTKVETGCYGATWLLNGKMYKSHSELRFNGTVAPLRTNAINSTELSKIFIWVNYEGSKTVSKHELLDLYMDMKFFWVIPITLGFF